MTENKTKWVAIYDYSGEDVTYRVTFNCPQIDYSTVIEDIKSYADVLHEERKV